VTSDATGTRVTFKLYEFKTDYNMDNVNIKKMEIGNAFTKCSNIDRETDNPGNCYGDGDGGWDCDSNSCDAPSSDE
jgi:hypothetical protein